MCSKIQDIFLCFFCIILVFFYTWMFQLDLILHFQQHRWLKVQHQAIIPAAMLSLIPDNCWGRIIDRQSRQWFIARHLFFGFPPIGEGGRRRMELRRQTTGHGGFFPSARRKEWVRRRRRRWMKGFPCPSWLFHETLAAKMRVVVSVLCVPLPLKRRGGLAMRRRVVWTESSCVVAGLSELLNPGRYYFILQTQLQWDTRYAWAVQDKLHCRSLNWFSGWNTLKGFGLLGMLTINQL